MYRMRKTDLRFRSPKEATAGFSTVKVGLEEIVLI